MSTYTPGKKVGEIPFLTQLLCKIRMYFHPSISDSMSDSEEWRLHLKFTYIWILVISSASILVLEQKIGENEKKMDTFSFDATSS